MPVKTFAVVVYDIPADKRRNKLHKTLKDFGDPVQFSVFECWLNKKEMESMLKRVKHIIRPKLDHVRIYTICQACQAKIMVLGRDGISKEDKVYVV